MELIEESGGNRRQEMPISSERLINYPSQLFHNIAAPSKNHPLARIDLSFSGIEAQHCTHGLQPYAAAINPPLVSRLIAAFVPQHGRLLDPYYGGDGGSSGRPSRRPKVAEGDIDPLAVLVSAAKTTYIPEETVRKCADWIVARTTNRQVDKKEAPEAIRFWFKGYTIEPLLNLSEVINGIPVEFGGTYAEPLKVLFQVVLSATVRDVMLTYRGEVRSSGNCKDRTTRDSAPM